MTHGEAFTIDTKGNSDIRDITGRIQKIVEASNMQNGIVCISAVGSTASISTIEYEPALVMDFQDQLEKFASQNLHSRHSQTWGDDNGYSHIRATFMGPSITIALSGGTLVLGTWQQIVVIDHDNRPRSRKIFVQIVGE